METSVELHVRPSDHIPEVIDLKHQKGVEQSDTAVHGSQGANKPMQEDDEYFVVLPHA